MKIIYFILSFVVLSFIFMQQQAWNEIQDAHKIHVKTSGEMTPAEAIIYLYAKE